jgi:hypothetical protein
MNVSHLLRVYGKMEGLHFLSIIPLAKIYWNTGSFDYCDAIAVLNKGYVSVSGHLEIKNPKDPMVRMNSTECGFYFTNGNIYIFDKNEEYTFSAI